MVVAAGATKTTLSLKNSRKVVSSTPPSTCDEDAGTKTNRHLQPVVTKT